MSSPFQTNGPSPTDLTHVEGQRVGVFDLARTAKYDTDTLVTQPKHRRFHLRPSNPVVPRWGFSFLGVMSCLIHGIANNLYHRFDPPSPFSQRTGGVAAFVGMAVVIRPMIGSAAHKASTSAIRLPIHAMTGTAIELPNALYRGPSGLCGLLRHGMSV